jgi:peptide/nickel transport system permease protein
VRHDRFWRENFTQLWCRRRWAIVVIAIYLLIALLDSVSWISGGDLLTADTPRTIIDRIFQPERFSERSYSAPLANAAFYGGQPLEHPGAHLLGTDILGRDVVYRTLKGVRVALLIGGLTSLVVIPIALLFGVSAGYFGRRIDDAVFFVMTVLSSVLTLLLPIALIGARQGRGRCGRSSDWLGTSRRTRPRRNAAPARPISCPPRALGVTEGASHAPSCPTRPSDHHHLALTFTGLVLSDNHPSYSASTGRQLGPDDRPAQRLSRTPIIWWNLAGASVALLHVGADRQPARRRLARHHRSAYAAGVVMSAHC